MKGTIRVTVKVAGFQKERRFVPGTPARVRKVWKTAIRAQLEKRHPQPEHRGQSGTLATDAARYYPLIKHLADWVSRRSEIRAWLKTPLGAKPRHTITRDDVRTVIGQWRTQRKPVAVKSVNNRVTALRNLYRVLDGDDAPTPCDAVKPLKGGPKTPPVVVNAETVNAVAWRLAASTAMHAARDRAVLMVLASTGKRPCEVERAQPTDVDTLRRVWAVRDAKGGWSEGVYLNDEMVIAWEAFIAADAWGKIPDHFPRRLRLAGWPAGVRVYNLRHSTWITASERGADLSDIQVGCGHRNLATTRLHYVPVLRSRMQKLSELLEGRFGWQARLAPMEKPA